MANPASLVTKAGLLAAINSGNPTEILTVNDFLFGQPEPLVNDKSGRNTKITIRPLVSESRSGDRTFYYDRLQLTLATNGPITMSRGGAVTSSGLLTSINQTYGLSLTAADVVVETIPSGSQYVIQAAPGSISWIGALTCFFLDGGAIPQGQFLELDDGSYFELDDGSLFLLD